MGSPLSTEPTLPPARGPLTEGLFRYLHGAADRISDVSRRGADAVADDDLQLALYCCYELHYRGFAGVDPTYEWDPALLAFRAGLEQCFVDDLAAGCPVLPVRPDATVDVIDELLARAGGPSLSTYAEETATVEELRELAMHRSAYQRKEADPHTWALPRLWGEAKAAMVEIQVDEYGNGVAADSHAELFADTMTSLGLDSTYGAYLDLLPGITLATVNLISLFGLHRRWRGALVGHLAVFEMTSVVPMQRYSNALARAGVGAEGRKFYDVHVAADAVHEQVARDRLVAGFVAAEPARAADVVFGARALMEVESRFTAHVLAAWQAGRSSLLPAAAGRSGGNRGRTGAQFCPQNDDGGQGSSWAAMASRSK